MFEPNDQPRLFAVAPGVDFPRALAEGLLAHTAGQPPQTLARVQLIVNTRRMQRRLRQIFDTGPAMLMPQVRLITDLDLLEPGLVMPPAIPPLRRRLELISLVARLLEQQRDLAPETSLYALTDSLAALMDEMQGEGVSADAIAALDVTDQSGHWQRAQKFIQIAQTYVDASDTAPDAEARQRLLVDALTRRWAESPPEVPVIIAGSTASRGATRALMKAVASLPQGALVLPGFDFDMPAPIWDQLGDAMTSQDHPQYRFYQLIDQLKMTPDKVIPWHDRPPPSPERNALVSLSLRPAPVTDAWLTEGAELDGIAKATAGITMLDAPGPREEALAIAMRLRAAAETGQTAALITPDRVLTRQVSAALDQWGIMPDDSAGSPLHLSPPGRFLRHVADLFTRQLDAEALLTLLKHPLTHSGTDRGPHVLNSQRLELRIRDRGLPYPDRAGIARLLEGTVETPEAQTALMAWAAWVGETFIDQLHPGLRPLTDWVAAHLALAERIATGLDGPDTGKLWRQKSGQSAQTVMEGLRTQAPFGPVMSASDYTELVSALLSGEEVRDRDAPHPGIMIWGTLEARVQGADLVILAGLNEGTWPEPPDPDPWLNRSMRHQAGLLLPDRRIGLAAHDYQQAIGAAEVWLTRGLRSDDAETVASRWLNRLRNLLGGLTDQGGPDALTAMIARGDDWLARAAAFEEVTATAPAARPSPRPPVSARPRRLSVTEIKRLIRDPYAIYARHVLKLTPLGPLVQSPDALMRGTVAHAIFERFVQDTVADPGTLSTEHLTRVAQRILEDQVPWPAARAMWLARTERIAEWFIAGERARRADATPIAFEAQAKGQLVWPDLDFTLRARADRIDRTEAGEVLLYDYKTGAPPTAKQQRHFDKQLLIEAAMMEQGGFATLGPHPVAAAVFIGLGPRPTEVAAPLADEPPAKVLENLRTLITAYLHPGQGYTARRMMLQDSVTGDYDHLARFGEWDATDAAQPEDLA
ncbi:double-strand break repair protein AddB [uncultured Roseobacter sp.]|uniref:double-strand break repair protein AddB n=1 Tax=uncultured Roseobacter sp. TaxID=114847 RepID=UPI00261A940E|nr:double-strand break repair protein AddB [uncultured Roseobacter sp.]